MASIKVDKLSLIYDFSNIKKKSSQQIFENFDQTVQKEDNLKRGWVLDLTINDGYFP